MDHMLTDTMQGGPRKIRYAVVGLGHISQAAVLPAFKNAKDACELTALVSDDGEKLRELGRKYKVKKQNQYSYAQYDQCMRSGQVDAVYVALPNHMHAEYTVRAAEAGVHILCEKPMAVTEEECRQMIMAAETHRVRLMIAYRLHFEDANLRAAQIAQSNILGTLKYFSSSFSMQAKEGGIRLRSETGGGTLYDIGVYCINAARYLFREEPTEVFAWSASTGDPRFTEVDETTSALLKFPGERLATFTTSFASGDVSTYRLVGTEGDLRLEPAYDYVGKMTHYLTLGGKTTKEVFAKRDQFAPELLYFAKCIVEGKDPEPSGLEGLADVRIIEALYRSIAEGRPIRIEPVQKRAHPTPNQAIERPPVSEPALVHTESPHF